MYLDWQKLTKRFLTASFLLCFGFQYSFAQTVRQPSKQPNSIEQMLSQATSLMTDARTDEDYARIKTILLKILSAAPKNVAAHSLAGFVADRQNDWKTAEKHFTAAVKLQPNSPETHNNYGAVLMRLNRKNEAAKEFEISLKLNPNQPSAQANLAQILFERGTLADLQKARQLFEKVFNVEPDAEIARSLIIISLRLNETESASQNFARYVLLSKNITLPAASRIELASALLERGLNANAVQEMENVVNLDSSNVEALILLSRAYLKQKNIKSAGATLEAAVARKIDDAKIYAALADVYIAGGYYENAIPAMRLAIEKAPRNEYYRAQYGLLLIDSRAPAAAVIRLNEAVKEFPGSSRLWLALGIAQQADGKMTEAQNSFEKSLQIEPNSAPALAYLATSLIERAQYAEAVKTYQRALALEEKNAVLHYLLADTLLKIPTSDQSEIRKHLVRSIELDEKLAPAHLTLGKLYARDENWQQAVNEFEKAVKFAPDSAESHYQFGRALARLKRTDESKAAFEKYKRLNETQTAKKENNRQELVRRLANVRF